jgi:hypothetical protein
MQELPDRAPGTGEIRVRVTACGVCRTDLHVVDGELPGPMESAPPTEISLPQFWPPWAGIRKASHARAVHRTTA